MKRARGSFREPFRETSPGSIKTDRADRPVSWAEECTTSRATTRKTYASNEGLLKSRNGRHNNGKATHEILFLHVCMYVCMYVHTYSFLILSVA